jgi:hypothetical protein
MTARKYCRATTTPADIATDFTSGSGPQMSRSYLSYNHVMNIPETRFVFSCESATKMFSCKGSGLICVDWKEIAA